MSAQERKLQPPHVTPENRPFWDAATAGRLMIGACTSCGESHYYPRSICPHCGSERTGLREASGRGTIYTYSIMRRAPVPYAIAFVTLAEGVTMMTNIVDCDLDAVRIGQPVTLVLKATEGGPPLPMFAPA
jgi:uncharacterized OB-fold protein